MTDAEVSFTDLEAGVRRLTLPLPTGPRHVHCYIVDGTLFDAGLGLEAPPWRELGIERIAITHFHPDHVGGAEAAASESGASVYQGGLEGSFQVAPYHRLKCSGGSQPGNRTARSSRS